MKVAEVSRKTGEGVAGLSPRVRCGLRLARENRFHRHAAWGDELSVLDASTKKLPLVIRKALAVKKMLSEMPVVIKDHELLVGTAAPATILHKTKLPEYATREEIEQAAKRLTSPESVYGHISPYYPRYLEQGLTGLQAAVRKKIEEIEVNGGDPQKRVWYESVVISLEGMNTLIRRYQQRATALLEKEAAPERKSDLSKIVAVLQQLLCGPPRTFHQALQAVWFAHISFTSTLNYSPLGRFDQYLWPYLQRDLENGLTTLTDAQELVDLFWLKCNDLLKSFQIQHPPAGPEEAVSVANTVSRAGKFSAFLGGKTTIDRMFSDGGTSQQFLQTIQ